MPKLLSQRMEMTIPGRPLTSGKPQSDGCFRGKAAYLNILKLSTKMAMKEWGWERTDEPIFIVVKIFLGIHDNNLSKRQIREKCSSKFVPKKRPHVLSFSHNVVRALIGTAIKSESQIVGVLVKKRYDMRERVEILVGKPSNMKEFEHDIRRS